MTATVNKPIPLTPNFERMPAALRDNPTWVLWRYQPAKDGRWTKVPKTPSKRNASTTNADTWSTFDQAKAAYQKGGFDGVGFVLTNGIAGVDLDHATNPDGVPAEWAAGVLERFSGTYRERSPSGEGFRIFAHGQPRRCGKGGPVNYIEVYAKDSPRYLTVTGHALDDVPDVTEQQQPLDWLHREHMDVETRNADDDLIQKVTQSTNAKLRRLWIGSWPGYYPSQSEADLALVNLLATYTKDVAQLDRLFRQSGLMRPKWDERHGQRTYGAETIDKALRSGPRPGSTRDRVNVDGLIVNAKDEPKACEHNAVLMMEAAAQYASMHFDEFLSRIRIDGRDWRDADDLALLCWLQASQGVAGFTLGQARNAARAVAFTRRKDSLIEFVETLPEWDGTARLEHAFTDALGAPDTTLMRAASKNFFVALMARAIQPGAQVDTVWCFEGAQGIGKSKAMRALGQDFHAELTAAIGTTDFMRELRGVWIAELSELDSLRGREASTVKRLLSAPKDRFVEKYQAHTEVYPRRAVAVATTNEADYWQDATGARRLIPVPCGRIDVDAIHEHRLQWFAEARHLHADGATWWTFPKAMADEQEARQQVDPWEDTLRGYMEHGKAIGQDEQHFLPWPEGFLASAEIMSTWLDLAPHQQGKASGVRLGHVMRRLGYQPERQGKARERGWSKADTQLPLQIEVSA